MEKSNCIYCKSTSYGTGCMYSPTNTHVHMDNPGGCIYCGTPSVGSGCLFNPYGNIHITSPEFLNRSAIQTEKASLLSYFFNSVSTISESEYKSPLDRLYKRVSAIIASAAEPFIEAFRFQETPLYENVSKQDFIKILEFKKRFSSDLKQLKRSLEEANLNFSKEIVEKTLKDAILDIKE